MLRGPNRLFLSESPHNVFLSTSNVTSWHHLPLAAFIGGGGIIQWLLWRTDCVSVEVFVSTCTHAAMWYHVHAKGCGAWFWLIIKISSLRNDGLLVQVEWCELTSLIPARVYLDSPRKVWVLKLYDHRRRDKKGRRYVISRCSFNFSTVRFLYCDIHYRFLFSSF